MHGRELQSVKDLILVARKNPRQLHDYQYFKLRTYTFAIG